MKLAKFSAKLVANFQRSLEGDFRASFAGENRQKHFPPKRHRKFHHQTSLRGSGLWRALSLGPRISKIVTFFCQGSIAGKDILEVRENICQNHALETTLLRSGGAFLLTVRAFLLTVGASLLTVP